MDALIKLDHKTSSILLNTKYKFNWKEGFTVLKQKIEDSIMQHKSVIICISNPGLECRNTIYVEDYEFQENNLYLNDGDFDLHIEINEETEIKHDNLLEDEFMIVNKDTETKLYFMD